MKKIKILLLFFLMIACGTIIAVSGFYINENSKVVIDWFNGNIAVTNGDYKELVEETTVTIGYLEAKISNLETENASLTSEKDSLIEQVQDLMLNAEENQEIIDLCLEQIDNLNSQLAENEVLIKDLKALIRSLSEKTIKSIIDLPEELNSATLNFNWIGNNALIYTPVYNGVAYYFDYNAGTLKYLTTGNLAVNSYHYYFHSFNDGFIAGWYGYSFAYRYSTGEVITTVPKVNGNHPKVIECDNGCYIFVPGYIKLYYFDYSTFTTEQIYSHSTNVETSSRVTQFGSDAFIECYYMTRYSSRNNLYYLNCETKEFIQLFANSSSHVKIFKLKGNYYILRSYIGEDSGLYRINLIDKTFELVYNLYDTTADFSVEHFFEFENLVVFSKNETLFSFDGETVTQIYEMTGWKWPTSGPVFKQDIIYEDDEVCYSSALSSRIILKYVKSTCEASVIYFGTDVMYNYTMINDHTILFTGRYLSTLDVDTGTLNTNYYNNSFYSSFYRNYFEFGDYIVVLPIHSSMGSASENKASAYCFNKIDLSYYTIGYRTYVTGESISVGSKFDNNKYIFTFSGGGCCVFNPVGKIYRTYDSDNSLCDFDERTIYVKVKDLEEGGLYYKYQYNEDLTEYTRSLVIVE